LIEYKGQAKKRALNRAVAEICQQAVIIFFSAKSDCLLNTSSWYKETIREKVLFQE